MDKVLSECKEPDYWFAASRDGNRESHYRGQALYDVALLTCGCVSPCGGLPQWEQADESQEPLCVPKLASCRDSCSGMFAVQQLKQTCVSPSTSVMAPASGKRVQQSCAAE